MSNRFQTANSHTGANGGRLSGSHTDQRRWVSASAGIGKASTRPSRSTKSRQTGAGMIFEATRARVSTAVDATHPWKASVKKVENELQAVVIEGKIMKGLLNPSLYALLAPEAGEDPLPPVVVEIGHVVFIEITYPTSGESEEDDTGFIFDIKATSNDDFEPFDKESDEEDPMQSIIVRSRYPIALVVASGTSEDAPAKITQLARSNVALTTVCINGDAVKYLLPV